MIVMHRRRGCKINPESLPSRASLVTIFGVDYAHIQLDNRDDLYLTKYGLPFWKHLYPENYWTDIDWFNTHSERLAGSGTLYRIRTKQFNEQSKDVVLKWSRMGQDIPAGHHEDFLDAEFNSPYEEFSLVMELRDIYSPQSAPLLTHKPLAIYAPSGRVELWQSGRREHKMQSKADTHLEVDLDMHRSYAVIYEWIKGIDAFDAYKQGMLTEDKMNALTLKSKADLLSRGFDVKDSKAHHVIVRPNGQGSLLRDQNGNIRYALVDFELLERTKEREESVRQKKRRTYLVKQRDRFNIPTPTNLPPYLKLVNVLGVEYIYGHVESTKGLLWIVGKDASLFDYFLPEKWRHTSRDRLADSHEIYHTKTKDNIHLAWRISRVGTCPNLDPFRKEEKRILDYGYNCPFEEVSLAIELSSKGIHTTYPRAIYMSGSESGALNQHTDTSRYEHYKNLLTPEGERILCQGHYYITIWGYWNGPDESLALKDGDYYKGINALQAYRTGILSKSEYFKLMRITKKRLAEVGFEDINYRGTHLVLSLNSMDELIMDSDGIPDVRICNFELLSRIENHNSVRFTSIKGVQTLRAVSER